MEETKKKKKLKNMNWKKKGGKKLPMNLLDNNV